MFFLSYRFCVRCLLSLFLDFLMTEEWSLWIWNTKDLLFCVLFYLENLAHKQTMTSLFKLVLNLLTPLITTKLFCLPFVGMTPPTHDITRAELKVKSCWNAWDKKGCKRLFAVPRVYSPVIYIQFMMVIIVDTLHLIKTTVKPFLSQDSRSLVSLKALPIHIQNTKMKGVNSGN